MTDRKSDKERTCPMIVRGLWDNAEAHRASAWHQLCETQSPVGLKGGMTGAWLVFLNGAHRGEDARLPMGLTSVGAGWHANLVLTSPSIGSAHASFSVSDGTATVTPATPARDVRVNGETVKGETRLCDGDLVSFGELHAVMRFAKAYAPGYMPSLRPRPELAPPVGPDTAVVTVGWLVATRGAGIGRDWRLIRGLNRLGSALGLEVTWTERSFPAEGATLRCELDARRLAAWSPEVRVLVNGQPATVGQDLRDSDHIAINDAEFYLKCV
jgi:hypothetical protein